MDAIDAARQFVNDQVSLLQRRDVTGLLEQHYHADALLMTPQATIRGHDELRTYFTRYVEALRDFTVDAIDQLNSTADAILIEATVTSTAGRARVYDAFVLRDGRITHHFAGVLG